MLGERFTALTLLSLAVFAGCTRFEATVSPPPPPPPAAPAKVTPPAPPPPPPAAPAKVTPPVAPVPPPPSPSPKLAPQLSPPEEERLRRDATARIDATERIIRQVADRRLGTNQQETLATIQSFVDKARQALGAQDLQQAFTLADKAEALAQDLLRTTR